MKERINKILHHLNKDLFEREEVIQLTLLATLAGESIFLLGPPGVAKSLVARRMKYIFLDGKSFEYLMNRFSTPDEIFGPIAISKLKNEDKYERLIESYLPAADIVFLDEIWKAGPAIQNSLLTVINEKVFRNGTQEIKIPLKGLISASNELPTHGEGLEALWDRFIVRYLVTNITQAINFNSFLLSASTKSTFSIDEKLRVSNKEYKEWQEAIEKITLSEEAINVINVIRAYIDDYNKNKTKDSPIYVSDRRWFKIVRLLKTSAFLNERKSIDLMDCFLITHTIWTEIAHMEIVRGFVVDAIKNHGYSLKYNLKIFSDEIDDLKLDIKNQTQEIKTITYYEPKPHIIEGDIYFEIKDPKNELKGDYGRHYNFIKKSDYSKLPKNDYNERIVFYTKDLKSRYFEAGVFSEESVSIRRDYRNYWRGEEQAFKLGKTRKSKKEIETIRPHKAILKEWDEKVQRISETASFVINEIKKYQDTELKGLKENLFVNKAFASFPEHNLNLTIRELVALIDQAKKMKKDYEQLT